MVVALVLASCAPAAKPTAPTTPTTPTTQTTPTTPTTPTIPTVPTTPTAPVTVEKPKYGGTITVTEQALVAFDTYRASWMSARTLGFAGEKLAIADWAVDRNLWSFAVITGILPEKYARGCLLESWETLDPLTVVLHVRQGVHFQDKPPVNGREFTADDIIWNIERYTKCPFVSKANIGNIESMTKKDKWTVEVRLKPPAQLGLVRGMFDESFMEFWPKEAIGKSGEIDDWRNIIGTGPFMIEDYVADSCVTFKRNPSYWGFDEKHPEYRLPYADSAKVMLIADASTQYAGLRSGKLDWVYSVPYVDADNLLKTAPHLLSRLVPSSSAKQFAPRWDAAPTSDVRVRQAMNMALDRNEIIKSFFGGYADYYIPFVDKTSGIYVPYEKLPDKPMWTTVSCKEVLSYNPKKARELVAAAGYPNGFKISAVTSYPFDPGLAELLQSYLAKIGIQVEINAMEYGAYNALVLGKKNPGLLLATGAPKPDPFYYLAWFTTANQYNRYCVSDPYFDNLFYRAKSEFDDAKREQMLTEMNYYAIENALTILSPQYYEGFVWQPWLGGYAGEALLAMHHSGDLWARVWVDQELKKSLGF